MNIFSASILSLLLLSGHALANVEMKQEWQYTTSPFEISFAAYRGELKAQGIPGYQSFCQGYHWGQINERDVALAAANAGLLTQEEAVDPGFWGYLRFKILGLC